MQAKISTYFGGSEDHIYLLAEISENGGGFEGKVEVDINLE